MQREIKFRAWDNEIKTMQPWEIVSFVFPQVLSLEHISVMQYTGLKDKNGKELFIGDVVKAQDGVWEVQIENLADGVVLANDNKEEMSVEFASGDYSLNEVEVIGNLYENPELLK